MHAARRIVEYPCSKEYFYSSMKAPVILMEPPPPLAPLPKWQQYRLIQQTAVQSGSSVSRPQIGCMNALTWPPNPSLSSRQNRLPSEITTDRYSFLQ
ncbi:hypothetical protein TNCV_3112141 [Trichonephila clavipes]|nr:hypothetical protein TNCV_3112141 [Trichonephila clavipes]